ncbi:uncharacterized protein BYT42DRAFT_585152, partial [Radiomyces spectabilis]|uniref:uncharacterized protein n=1 Tax=Radiomyces spectabilis TaxID=64574 RepID=UPI00221F01F9
MHAILRFWVDVKGGVVLLFLLLNFNSICFRCGSHLHKLFSKFKPDRLICLPPDTTPDAMDYLLTKLSRKALHCDNHFARLLANWLPLSLFFLELGTLILLSM